MTSNHYIMKVTILTSLQFGVGKIKTHIIRKLVTKIIKNKIKSLAKTGQVVAVQSFVMF